jgi:FXSXX-COOH protein
VETPSARTPHLAGDLDAVLQASLDSVPTNTVQRVLRRIVPSEVNESTVDVAAFNSAI